MSDETVIDRDDEITGQPMSARPTKRDLVERGLDALDTSQMTSAKVSVAAGGVTFASVVEVMDFAKTMATSGKLVPKYLRGNPGGCLGITFQAIEWRMSPFQVAGKSYEVNDRIGYESQLIHAVVEARAPLQHRLDCRYEGELIYEDVEKTDEETGETFVLSKLNTRKSTRTCVVTGMFTTGDVREYESPQLKDIRVQNSPLWKDDPDQQLFYYASRSWARKWCPDVLMGIYAREELVEQPGMGREVIDDAPGLHARLAGSEKSEEGHKEGHAVRELDQIAGAGQVIEHDPPKDRPKTEAAPPARKTAKPAATDQPVTPAKRTSGLPTASPKRTKGEKPAKNTDKQAETEKSRAAILSEKVDAEIRSVKTAKQYLKYARKWIDACDDSDELFVRWNYERKHRNTIGVTAEDREPLDKRIAERREELEK